MANVNFTEKEIEIAEQSRMMGFRQGYHFALENLQDVLSDCSQAKEIMDSMRAKFGQSKKTAENSAIYN